MVGLAAAFALPTVIGAGTLPPIKARASSTTHSDSGTAQGLGQTAVPARLVRPARTATQVHTVVPAQPDAAATPAAAAVPTDVYDFGAQRVRTLAAAEAAEAAEQEKLFRQLLAWWGSRPHYVLPDPGVMTQGYGGADGHPGIDLAAAWGTPILAAADGVVIYSGWEDGYGNMIEIQLADGTCNVYGHMEALVSRVGDHVTAGQQIGFEGSTGHSTGPHLHFEVRASANGATTDPVAWLAARGIQVNRES